MKSNGSDRDSWKAYLWDLGHIVWPRGWRASPFWNNPRHLKEWMDLLLSAKYKAGYAPIKTGRGDTQVYLKRGQLLFGRNKFAERLNVKPSTLYKDMQYFESLGEIIIEENTHYSIVTIVDYEYYYRPQKREEQPNIDEQAKTGKSEQANPRSNAKKKNELSKKKPRKGTTNIEDKRTTLEQPSSTSYKDNKDNNSLSERENFPAKEIANLLHDPLKERDPRMEEPDLEVWTAEIGALLGNGRRPEEIEKVMRWALNDNHWRKIIIGPSAAHMLRKHYAQLRERCSNSEPEEGEDVLPNYYLGEGFDIRNYPDVCDLVWICQDGDKTERAAARTIMRRLAPGLTNSERERVLLEIKNAGDISSSPQRFLKERIEEILNARKKNAAEVSSVAQEASA